MKRTKFLCIVATVLLLFVLIATTSVINAGAYDHMLSKDFIPWEYEPTTLDDEHTVGQKASELFRYCDSLCTYFNCFPEDLEDGGFIYHADGAEILGFVDSEETLETVVRKVYNEVFLLSRQNKAAFQEKATDEFFVAYYDELKEASKKPQVANNEIGFLINICEKEDNSDGFYADTVWIPFVTALHNAKTAYNNNTYNGQNVYSLQVEDNSEIYWDLYFAYNELCMQISVSGDIDRNAETEIIDVTLLQRSLAGLTPRLNAAQRSAACVQSYTKYGKELYPDITDATIWQRKLAGLETHTNNYIMTEEFARCISFKANPLIGYEYHARMFPWYYD